MDERLMYWLDGHKVYKDWIEGLPNSMDLKTIE
jgi:hypothetical protein